MQSFEERGSYTKLTAHSELDESSLAVDVDSTVTWATRCVI